MDWSLWTNASPLVPWLTTSPLQADSRIQAILRDDGKNQQDLCERADESQQPDAQRNGQAQVAGDTTSDGTCSQNTGRQWDGPNPGTETSGRDTWLADGTCG